MRFSRRRRFGRGFRRGFRGRRFGRRPMRVRRLRIGQRM